MIHAHSGMRICRIGCTTSSPTRACMPTGACTTHHTLAGTGVLSHVATIGAAWLSAHAIGLQQSRWRAWERDHCISGSTHTCWGRIWLCKLCDVRLRTHIWILLQHSRDKQLNPLIMAGISFLDLLFAEAIAAGLARQARAAQPPPENFFVLPKDPRAWKLIHAKNKAENMVCAIEITNDGRENCRRVQPLYLELAREFEGIPFLQVPIAPGATYDEVC